MSLRGDPDEIGVDVAISHDGFKPSKNEIASPSGLGLKTQPEG